MSERIVVTIALLTRPIATPATGFLMAARFHQAQYSSADRRLDDEPFDSVMSETHPQRIGEVRFVGQNPT